MSLAGILGIVLMVIENELTFTRVYDRESAASWFIKLVITITTLLLVCLVVCYHRLDLDLFCNQNFLDDWRVGLDAKRVGWVLLEIAICLVHPIPGLYPSSDPPPISQNGTDPLRLSHISVDVGLGLPSKWYPQLRFVLSRDCQCSFVSTYSVGRPCSIPIWCAMHRCDRSAISITYPSTSSSSLKRSSSNGPRAACSSSAPYHSSSVAGACEHAITLQTWNIKLSVIPCGCSLSHSVP